MPAQLDREMLRVAPGRSLSRLIGYSMFEGRPLTTRGRWWNPVVFANLKAAGSLPSRTVDRPAFIVGMGRSGTTLLGRLFSIHPEVGFLNEPKALWHVIRDDEDVIGSYAAPLSGRLRLDAEDATAGARMRAHDLYGWYLTASRSSRVVDKYPELIFRAQFVRAVFPDARFLIAMRSPQRTLHSVVRWSVTHRRGDADWWGLRGQKWSILWRDGVLADPRHGDLAELDLAQTGDHTIRAAVEWVLTAREALDLDREPFALLTVHEELCGNPRKGLARAIDHLELDPSRRAVSYASATVRPPQPAPELPSTLPQPLADAISETWDRVCARDRS